MIYLLHGDEYLRKQALKKIVDASDGSLNSVKLDGAQASPEQIRNECLSLPLFGGRKVVIVSGWGKHVSGLGSEAIRSLFSDVPEEVDLVLDEEKLPPNHPFLKVLASKEFQGKAAIKFFQRLSIQDGSLQKWIFEEVRRRGSKIKPEAVRTLMLFVGDDLNRLSQEIEKLTLYANGDEITPSHVNLLVQDTSEASVFELVDALSSRRKGKAIRLYRKLLADGNAPLAILGMIVRQYRILISVKSLREEGLSKDEIAARLGLHPYPVKKALRQIGAFTFAELLSIYDRLLETDYSIKSGEMDAEVAVELLLATL